MKDNKCIWNISSIPHAHKKKNCKEQEKLDYKMYISEKKQYLYYIIRIKHDA